MIIHQPESRQKNGQHIVSARIEFERDYGMPNELWFSVDEGRSAHVSGRADIFLSTLIRVARAIREDIEVRGELSPQLLFGMREYLKVHAAWSGNHDIINIDARNPVPAKRTTQEAAASCNISGGIDSFHTLWSQLPENEPVPELQVKYGIYGTNFTSPTQNEVFAEHFIPNLSKLMKSQGVELLVVHANAPSFRLADAWISISPVRIALPFLFSPIISAHFLPSTDTYDSLKPFGTHPLTDHLFSLESLRLFTHSPDLLRFEKLRAMADWPLFYDYLYVCNNKSVKLNDSTCPKCTRTMLMVNILGIDEKIATFHIPFRKRSLLRRILKGRNHYLSLRKMTRYAIDTGRWDLIPFLIAPIVIYKLTKWIRPLLGYKFR